MYPQTHFLASYLIALIFVKFGVFDYKIALFAALVGLFIDIDHFLIYAFKYKDIGLRDSWNKAVKGLYHGRSFIHHQIGFIIMTLIIISLYFYNTTLFWILSIGYYSHMFVDYAQLNILRIREKMTIKEAGFITKINKFEVLLDISLVIGIILLLL
ncbi:MAG: metal-dependent hydrolase [archaeon]